MRLLVVALVAVALTGCSRPDADAAAANPLAMPLKHDGPPGAGAAAPRDPCARPEPTGPLAMGLRHDTTGPPGKPNPLCMKLE